MSEVFFLLFSRGLACDEGSCLLDVIFLNQSNGFVAREQLYGSFNVFAVRGVGHISHLLHVFVERLFGGPCLVYNVHIAAFTTVILSLLVPVIFLILMFVFGVLVGIFKVVILVPHVLEIAANPISYRFFHGTEIVDV